jgi:hypothetical protein
MRIWRKEERLPVVVVLLTSTCCFLTFFLPATHYTYDILHISVYVWEVRNLQFNLFARLERKLYIRTRTAWFYFTVRIHHLASVCFHLKLLEWYIALVVLSGASVLFNNIIKFNELFNVQLTVGVIIRKAFSSGVKQQ